MIVGSSGHAKVVIDIVERMERYRIAGLIDDFRPAGEAISGYAVLGKVADIKLLAERHALNGILVAIGDNQARSTVSAQIAAALPHLPFIRAIHPAAILSRSASIDPGTVVMAGAVINADCSIGPSCIVNTNASIDHDSRMDAFSSLAPRVVTGGHCHVGEKAAIGIGAVVKHRVRVGEHCIVGAGAVVLHDLAPYSVAYGIPAKAIRTREPGEPYL